MKTQRPLDTILDQMAHDPDFAKRTAQSVLVRAANRSRKRMMTAAVAALLLTAPVLFFVWSGRNSQIYPGVSRETARALSEETRTEEMWQETDLVIAAAFTSR